LKIQYPGPDNYRSFKIKRQMGQEGTS
jgi:hypothetical protein